MLDNNSCQCYHLIILEIQVIDDRAVATVALEPMLSRLLSELVAPASAATLATRVGLARQKVNYHLHALEAHGLVRLAQERKWGGLTERLLVATAASYVVSPSALGPIAVDPNREVDRLSASYLIALGARVVREVGDLVRRAKEAGKRLATEFEEGDGKPVAVKLNFGAGMESRSVVTAWDPPRMFAAQGEGWSGSPPIATEWSVEARAGGVCVVRVVHSLFASTDDWDN